MDVELLAIWLFDDSRGELGVLLCVVGSGANGVFRDIIKKENCKHDHILHNSGNFCFAYDAMVIGLLMILTYV